MCPRRAPVVPWSLDLGVPFPPTWETHVLTPLSRLQGRCARLVLHHQASPGGRGLDRTSAPQQLTVTPSNAGHAAVTFTIGGNAADGGGPGGTATVQSGGTRTVTLDVAPDGGYDYTGTADTGDGFERRFVGRTYPPA